MDIPELTSGTTENHVRCPVMVKKTQRVPRGHGVDEKNQKVALEIPEVMALMKRTKVVLEVPEVMTYKIRCCPGVEA